MSTVPENSEAAILDKVFRPDVGGWPVEAAEAILAISFDEGDREMMVRFVGEGQGRSPRRRKLRPWRITFESGVYSK